MEDFDRKLSETDAYLQLLIDQNLVLDEKVILLVYMVNFYTVRCLNSV